MFSGALWSRLFGIYALEAKATSEVLKLKPEDLFAEVVSVSVNKKLNELGIGSSEDSMGDGPSPSDAGRTFVIEMGNVKNGQSPPAEVGQNHAKARGRDHVQPQPKSGARAPATSRKQKGAPGKGKGKDKAKGKAKQPSTGKGVGAQPKSCLGSGRGGGKRGKK